MRRRLGLAMAVVLATAPVLAGLPLPVRAAETPRQAAPPAANSELVNQLARWATTTSDNRHLPFVVIDKVSAGVFVFDADGQLIGSTPALLGLAFGDDSTPGIGDRELSDIAPEDRTTPAGRFMAAYGPGPGREKVFWVDYETAISLHPVVTTKPAEHRLQRLRSASIEDNRITFGCINVPAAFYEKIVRKTFTGTQGVVYILPEIKPLREVFPTFQLQMAANAETTAP